jgi:uncharacterized membrane protein
MMIMILEKMKLRKRKLILAGLLAAAAFFTWLFLSNSLPGCYGKILTVGSSVCHQIPSHSFSAGDIQFPVCARCAGLYLGSFIGLVYALISGKKKGIPEKGYLILMTFLFILWAGDGLNSFMSDFINKPFLYQTNNLTRLITGYGMGLVMSTALGTLVNITVWDKAENSALLDRIEQILGYAALCVIISLMVLTENALLLQIAGYITIFTVVTIISLLYAVFWIITFRKENQFSKWRQVIIYLVAGYATAIGQVLLLVSLRNKII